MYRRFIEYVRNCGSKEEGNWRTAGHPSLQIRPETYRGKRDSKIMLYLKLCLLFDKTVDISFLMQLPFVYYSLCCICLHNGRERFTISKLQKILWEWNMKWDCIELSWNFILKLGQVYTYTKKRWLLGDRKKIWTFECSVSILLFTTIFDIWCNS